VVRRVASVVVVGLLVLVVAACGPTTHKSVQVVDKRAAEVAALLPTRLCFRKHGYSVTPDSATALKTASPRFDFLTVWNLLNPNRVALAVTFSRSLDGAKRAEKWVRRFNKKLSKGKVDAPVVRFGKVNVLWTAKPDPPDTRNIYGCIRQSA
jgi:hypothetical protein